VLLGAQPVWDPQQWLGIVARKSSLRGVLREWLVTRGLPPLGFMVTPELLDAVEDRRVFVAERGSAHEPIAFLIATPIPARGGWLVEQWPRTRAAPNGTTHLLVDAAMRAFATAGSRGAGDRGSRGRRAAKQLAASQAASGAIARSDAAGALESSTALLLPELACATVTTTTSVRARSC